MEAFVLLFLLSHSMNQGPKLLGCWRNSNSLVSLVSLFWFQCAVGAICQRKRIHKYLFFRERCLQLPIKMTTVITKNNTLTISLTTNKGVSQGKYHIYLETLTIGIVAVFTFSLESWCCHRCVVWWPFEKLWLRTTLFFDLELFPRCPSLTLYIRRWNSSIQIIISIVPESVHCQAFFSKGSPFLSVLVLCRHCTNS